MTEQPTAAQPPADVAAQQIQGIAADIGAQQPAADLTGQLAASGAHPGEVDTAALLAEIRALQDRVGQMESDKRMEAAPDVVRYAQALSDHVAAKVAAHPVTAADPDLPGKSGTDLAAAVLEEAKIAAESGDVTALNSKVEDVLGWVRAHAGKFNHIDWTYVLQLAEEIGISAAKLVV